MKLHYIRSRKWRACLAVFFGLGLLALSLPRLSLASSDFSYSISSRYDVRSDSSTAVEESYSVVNNTPNRFLQSIQLSAPVDDATDLTVEYEDGTAIPFTTNKKVSSQSGYSYDYVEINITFPRNSVGQNSRWGFVVSYSTAKLVETKGSAHTVSIPAVPQDASDKYSVELLVPESFGSIHATGQAPTRLENQNGQQRYVFKDKESLKKTTLLVFGDSTIYEVNFNFPLDNKSNFTSTFTVALPPNTSGQKILLQKLDPQPKSTRLDSDGNILADYDVPAGSKIVVQTSVIGVISYIDYDLSKSGTLAEIPKDLVTKYTSPQQYWDSTNPEIVAKANELTKGKNTVAEQVRAINDYVVSTLTYNDEKIKYNLRQGGLKALQEPSNAVCLEYSDLTISLLRAAKIPARMPVGYGYSGNLKKSSSVSDSLHSWVQAYVPNIGWMNLDPTWNEKFNSFGSSDLDHMAFILWGEKDNSPAPIMQNGQDTSYQYENTTISYKDVPPIIAQDGKLEAKKWLILPFLAITKTDVQAPSGTAGDSYSTRSRQGSQIDTVELGSLAPRQKVSKLKLVLGATAFGGASIDFAQAGANSIVLDSTKIRTQLWPAILIAILLAGTVIYKVVRFSLRKSYHKVSSAKLVSGPIPTQTNSPEESSQNGHNTKK